MYGIFEKNKIKKDIYLALTNRADLKVIKQIYENKEIKPQYFRKTNDFYTSDVPLSKILDDLYMDFYLSDNLDKNLIPYYKNLIDEYNLINPFDKLDNLQKEKFLNIKTKLGNNYNIIHDDLVKLSDNFYEKNLLINKYFKNSTAGFWISIIALILTLGQILNTFIKYLLQKSLKKNEAKKIKGFDQN